MGIPSYFRHLTKTVRGLLYDAPVAGGVDWLCLDFNCMIYHVLQRPDMVIGGGIEWENWFVDEIVRYALKVVRRVNPVKGVYLAVDGVVPMAKIRQQRMRRFRGSCATGADSAESTRGGCAADSAAPAPAKFSRNAITPGTDFMRRLGERLARFSRDHPDLKIKVSPVEEAGEGEHKVLNFIRRLHAPDNIVVYGLDADLIVLSMIAILEKDIKNISLFREVVENGEIERDSLGEEKFHFFSVNCLADYLMTERGSGSRGYLRDYCNAMMLLGNDFLPSSMTFRIRDDGHDMLCSMIRDIRGAVHGLATQEPLPVDTLMQEIISRLAEREEEQFKKVCWRLVNDRKRDCNDEEIFLRAGDRWRDVYNDVCLKGVDTAVIVREYRKGMRWVLDYYSGKSVDQTWVYAWHYPPLWGDLASYVGCADEHGLLDVHPLKPVEQLALVLPIESWHLIPSGAKERRLPLIAPEWFPKTFRVNKIGRKMDWEYEPEIPIPTISELRARLSCYDV